MKKKQTIFLISGATAIILICAILLLIFRNNYSKDTLIVYFTRTGNTEFGENVEAVSSASLRRNGDKLVGNSEVLAKDLHGLLGAETFAIRVKNLYPEAYQETVDIAREEKNTNARPELLSHIEDMEKYKKIILIYPVWWSTIPMPVYTFLEEYDFAGKTILPIATHKGSFLGDSVEDIRALLPEAKVKTGIAVSGSSVDFLMLWFIGVFVGIIIVIISGILRYNWKTDKKKARIALLVCVFGIVVIVYSIVRLII